MPWLPSALAELVAQHRLGHGKASATELAADRQAGGFLLFQADAQLVEV
jgi:hypothetical protein